MDASITVEGLLDVERTLARYRLWGEDPATHFGAGILRRAIRVDGACWGYEMTWRGGPERPVLTVSVPGRGRGRALDAALAEVRQLCGLGFDLTEFYRAAGEDRVLGGLVPRLSGLRPTLMPQPLEMLVGAICAQQVNLSWAFTVRSRLVRRYGTAVPAGRGTVHAFPDAEALGRASLADLRAMQFTTRKAEYIAALGRLAASGELDLDGLEKRSNDEVIEILTGVRGLGRWTAEWFLARGLGRGDVCPAGDLGVRKAFGHFYAKGRDLPERVVRRRAAAWTVHQNLAVHYLLAGHRLEAQTSKTKGAR